jgi:hypothetical protein
VADVSEWYVERGRIRRRSLREWALYELQLLQAAGIKPSRLGDSLLVISEVCGRPVKLLVRLDPQYPYEPPKVFYSFGGPLKSLCYMRREEWRPFHHTLAFVFMQSLAMLRQEGAGGEEVGLDIA